MLLQIESQFADRLVHCAKSRGKFSSNVQMKIVSLTEVKQKSKKEFACWWLSALGTALCANGHAKQCIESVMGTHLVIHNHRVLKDCRNRCLDSAEDIGSQGAC